MLDDIDRIYLYHKYFLLLNGVNNLLQEESKFEQLRKKDILCILNGDTNFGDLIINGTEIKISMPYLNTKTLCNISEKFGMTDGYYYRSRWELLNALLEHCIQHKCEMDLIALLFSKSQFVDKLKGQTPEVIDYVYSQIVNVVIDQINRILYFSGYKLVQIGNVFVVREESTVNVSVPSFKTIDRSYIKDLADRAMKDVMDGSYDSAITKSRTLLEEVFCYVIEKKGKEPSESGDIGKLYNQVKQLYNMHQSKDIDKRINGLLSGLEKILSAIAEMRNKGSDAHGVGVKRINIAEHHTRLFVNSAIVMADFILSVSEKASQ